MRHGAQPRARAHVEAYPCCSCPLWLRVQQALCVAVGGRAACWPSLCHVMVVTSTLLTRTFLPACLPGAVLCRRLCKCRGAWRRPRQDRRTATAVSSQPTPSTSASSQAGASASTGTKARAGAGARTKA